MQTLCQEVERNKRDDRCAFNENRTLIWLNYGVLSHNLAFITLNNDESLLSVEVHGSKGEMYSMVEVLTEKHGKPVKSKEPIENKMGTKFDKEIFMWRDKNGSRITVESIYGKIDKGRILIESAKAIALSKAAEKVIRAVGKDNL